MAKKFGVIMKIVIVCIFVLIVLSRCIPTRLFNENSYFLTGSLAFSVLAASSNNEVYLASFSTLYKISDGSLSKCFSFLEGYAGGFFSDHSMDNNDIY